jgi:aspartyl-tRNA(Asn)/glutamyl-tRNA(Gln) amidotransferase subunit C
LFAIDFLPTPETLNEKSTPLNGQPFTNFYPFFMQVDKQLISRLEKLARLQLSDEQREKLGEDLQHILDMVGKLRELNTDGVAPLVYLNDQEHVLRPDEVARQLDQSEALKNAPKHDGKFFRVPKVIQ